MINFKQVLSKKNGATDDRQVITETMKGNLTAAAIGAGMGLVLASTKDKSLSLYGGIGAVIGLTLMYLSKPKKEI